MPKRYDLLVFDWDGTLMDSTASIVRAIQLAFRDMDKPVPSDDKARHVIGLGLADAMRYLDPELDADDVRQVVDCYRHYYLSRDHEIELFAGVREALQRYRQQGFWLAIATGKSRMGLDRALQHSGLGELFDVSRTADETFSKPHPAMLEQIIDYTGSDPRRTLMIGDTSHDLLLAQNARADGFGVSYGAHPRHELEQYQAVSIADSFAELDAWLCRHA
ncbi:MAG: HAD-IA family hydrolase [Chitinivorax sp.]